MIEWRKFDVICAKENGNIVRKMPMGFMRTTDDLLALPCDGCDFSSNCEECNRCMSGINEIFKNNPNQDCFEPINPLHPDKRGPQWLY